MEYGCIAITEAVVPALELTLF